MAKRKKKVESKGLFDDFRNAYKGKKNQVKARLNHVSSPSTDAHGLPVAKTVRKHTRWYWR